jgi:hypothetical protein
MAITSRGLTNGGRTTHYQFEYDDTLGTSFGTDRTNALMAAAESDFTLMASWFPGITPFKPPRKVQVLGGSDGAEWGGLQGDDVRLKEETAPANELRYLLVSEIVEQFMQARHNGWFDSTDEGSRGEALSRFMGIQFLIANHLGSGAPARFGLTAGWLNDATRADFVTASADDNQPDLRNGCGSLFLFYLHDQLGYSVNQIVNAGANTLADVFHTLTGRTNAFTEFRQLIDAHHPLGVMVSPSGESIFPVVDLVSFATLNEVTAGYGDTTTIALSGVAKADFTVALSSDDPTLLPVPATVSVTPGMNSIPLPIQTVAQSLVKAVTVQIHASYAGRTISLGVVVAPPRILSVLIKPATLVAGQSAAGVVKVNHPPLAGTIPIALSSSSPGFADVGRQAAVLVGHNTAPFLVEARASVIPFAPAQVTIGAQYAGSSADFTITVEPSVVAGTLHSVTLTMASLTGGHSGTGWVQLDAAVPADTLVGLAALEPNSGGLPQPGNQSTVASVPPSVLIPAGSTTAMFTITTKIVATTRTAIIMAGAVVQKTVTLTVTP